MLRSIHSYEAIYVVCGATDLRKKFDGLSIIVKQSFNLDPFGNSIFLFCNAARNRIKALVWDSNGSIMLYKRLDGSGARFCWPKDPALVRDISKDQLNLLLDGFAIDPPKGFSELLAREFY